MAQAIMAQCIMALSYYGLSYHGLSSGGSASAFLVGELVFRVHSNAHHVLPLTVKVSKVANRTTKTLTNVTHSQG